LITLHVFCSEPSCTDGNNPNAGLVQGSDGYFYGTTESGGNNTGTGTIFKAPPTLRSGPFVTLYSFCTQGLNCSDGRYPYGGLVLAVDGNFYGTTFYGGVNGGGSIFKITPNGILTTLYSFCPQTNCPTGGNPRTGLVQASDGNFYGTTELGGAFGWGVVFKITPAGRLDSCPQL